ncbi:MULTISPECIES: SGNH/GDSL hydrolase family protein [unclassified Niallia]|uniref:SGNH/GDSL hydrolase family protein n=1 Tax=Niallia TaxID=2837506 RepID=UPI001EDBB367|nr:MULTISPECIES: SGNH/GDSL hydrolase family protein [unclassified Niallia]MCM3033280.1 SGNH/GDSL hydrolase family protein [Niallia sp. MER 6]MDL0434894.1 SGNH/GDSL hydrolase family protein [Niallia sp. SS-2023]UPO89288.1 SGNH/GDSL hydrolase family protein [Niallia sp. Man26]
MKIICFGDSLTRGVTFVKGRPRILKDNYPSILNSLLQANGHTAEELLVLNKGVFNDDSTSLMNRLDKDVLYEKPDICIIGVGGNDCNFKWEEVAEFPELEHIPIVPLHDYTENVKAIVLKVKEYNIIPVILTLPPLEPVKYYKFLASKYGNSIGHWISLCGGIEHWHGLYNNQLQKLAKKLDVFTIDVRTNLEKAGDVSDFMSDDGIHLNADGYKEMAATVFLELNKLINGE